MYRLLIITLLFSSACANTTIDTNAENNGVQISYLNNSGEDFKLLDVEMFGRTYTFDNLAHGSATQFIEVEKAYPYHFARVITARDTLISQPIDYVGEQLLVPGKHTLILNIATSAAGERNLVFDKDGNSTAQDHHTRPSDVLDNLFLALNKKDWKVVNTFYSTNPIITDMSNDPGPGTAADYFKKLFEKEDIYYIYLHEQHVTINGNYAKAFTRRGTLSAEFPLCFNFVIRDNKIVEQHATTCED
jgi:hypothetical protein